MSKYDALRDHLAADGRRRIVMAFTEVHAVVGGLPRSARVHRAWWANEPGGRHVQANAWIATGYRVESADLADERVTFRRGAPPLR